MTGIVEPMDLDGALEEFASAGVVRVREVFSEDDAALMRQAVWRAWAERDGAVEHDPTTWTSSPWKTLHAAKRDPSFQAVLGKPLVQLADELLGPGWRVSKGFGNLLTSFPDATAWHLPAQDGLWHSDFGYQTPMDPLPGLRVFAVFGEVAPGGGGTLLVSGSHRMVERFVTTQPATSAKPSKQARPACHKSNPWLDELTNGDAKEPGRSDRFMGTVTDVDGIPARVIEACGDVGDVFVCHPWTIHCRPPNASDRPRFIRTPTLSRAGAEPPPMD